MKLNKILLAALLSTSGLLVAGNYIAGSAHSKKDVDKEKRNLGESFYSGLQKVKSSVYTKMSLAGAADGIPYGLRCSGVNDKQVSLTWNTPEATDGYFEDFENHDDFAVNSSGAIGWSYIDGDNKNTYSWSATNFKNQGQKMAFIVMNPSATEPSVEANPNYIPTSGKKMLVTMCSIGAPNNDWIISPELNFSEDFKFSFNARSYRVDGIEPERMRVGYSTGGKNQSSFTFITPSPYVNLPAEWKLYEYSIPKEAKYVCINCVSDDAFMMLIDDIFIGTNAVRPGIKPNNGMMKIQGRHLTGFNVYRDGVKVNSSLITEIRYTDTADTYAKHEYTVTAVYSDGTESAKSQPLTVDVEDPALLPFEDDFDDWYLYPDRWSTPDNPVGTQNNWGIDYYTYGLVDPAATYGYSALSNFDQSLVSRQLRTLNKDNTYLRFETRLEVWKIYPEETCYLAVEISNDNGATWQTIDTYNNSKGEEYWTTHLYSLKNYIKSDYFRLRWRCYGPTAMHLDYWYVDDVKVWNASFGSLRLNVTSADGAVRNKEVKLTGMNGSKYTQATDASGNIAIGQIETDRYAVDIVADGYNVYTDTIEVEADKTNNATAKLTRPVLTLSANKVNADMSVEEKTSRQFTISNTGDGPLTWRMNYAPEPQEGKAMDFAVNRSWKGSGDLQTSIAFDGEYYYTTSWYYLGEFWKYDRQGNLIEQFRIPEMYYKLYDFAYDGRYFYASDYSNRIFQLDFENKRIVDIIEITNAPELEITHIAYNPNNDRFYIGGWNTLCEVRRSGRATTMAAAFDPSETHAVYGSAYDNVTPGGPYLWLAAEETFNENMLDEVVIYQYSLVTKKFTGVKKVCTDIPGYVFGDATRGRNYICGLEGTVDSSTGHFTLVGALQQSPSLFFEYNIAETDTWLDFQPKKATLQPGESTIVNVNYDARNAEVGKSYSVDIPVLAIPEVDDDEVSVTIGFTATKASATPRPFNLSVNEDLSAGGVALSWEKPAVTPQSYNIYRNDEVIAKGVTATSYSDNALVRGTYKYEVSAVYGSAESVKSDSVVYTVKRGAPYYAPLDLTASLALNKDVTLQWQSPLAHASESATVGWSGNQNNDQMGATSGGTFYVASLWDADDLVPYRNKKITSASICIVNPFNYLALCIFKDGERIVRKEVTGPVTYGAWTTVTLDTPISIEPGSEYHIAFQVDHSAGMQPIGVDATTLNDAKGNLISMDGEYWFPASQLAIDGNFCVRFNVECDPSVSEVAPVGYNIYRNGEKINAAPVNALSYADQLTEAGIYTYAVKSVYAPAAGKSEPESMASEEVSVTVIDIGECLPPSALASEVERNRDVTLAWGFPVKGETTIPMDIMPKVTTANPANPAYVTSFMANGSEMAVASDGKFIYTSVYSEDGRVNVYDLNGKYLERFYFKELDGIRNMAYDGEYFWVADGNTHISKVDMQARKLLGQYNISEYARHISYIPELDNGNGGFEVGDWETSIYVTRRGAKIGDGPALKGASGTGYHDGLLYAFEQGNGNAHTISVYDMSNNRRLRQINLEDYDGLSYAFSSVAGGASVINTPEGLTFLAINAQNTQAASEVILLDIAGVKGVSGYNVYRDGSKVNGELLSQRVFRETIAEEGTHKYQVETVYIDGRTSQLSAPEMVTILPTGTADAPTDLQAVATQYGYDVALSFADPQLGSDVAVFEDFEGQQSGSAISVDGWMNDGNKWVASDIHYHGSTAMLAHYDTDADIIFAADDNKWIAFAARAVEAHNASVSVYTSSNSTNKADFILLDEVSLKESWSSFSATLPEGTRYVSIRHNGGNSVAVDAIRLNASAPASKVWGYDVFRNGKQLNDSPVRGISYIDHNLVPGQYRYQVRQHSVTAAVSPLSAVTVLNLNYSNGGQAPENLRVTKFSAEGVDLAWNAPALGDAVNLKWHSGNTYDAAGLPNGGSFYAGVRWPATDLTDFAHLSLSEVEVYVNQVPDALFLLVYQGNSLVHRQYVRDVRQYSYNTIKLNNPIKIDASKELRVVVYVEHNEITIPLGYDEGPARTGLGNLYSTDGIIYTTMDDDNTGIQGNWNITIGLKPYATNAKAKRIGCVEDVATTERNFSPVMNIASAIDTPAHFCIEKAGSSEASTINTFEGYNIYANNSLVNEEPILTTRYHDIHDYTLYPYVQYKVSAVYSLLGEVFADPVVIATDGIIDGIEKTTVSGIKVSASNGSVTISGTEPGTAYSIYNAGGMQEANGKTIGTTTVIPISAGIHILKIGNEIIKIAM